MRSFVTNLLLDGIKQKLLEFMNFKNNCWTNCKLIRKLSEKSFPATHHGSWILFAKIAIYYNNLAVF